MKNLWSKEPAMILGTIQAILAAVTSFGLQLTTEQIGAIMTVSSMIIGLITRFRVSPVK